MVSSDGILIRTTVGEISAQGRSATGVRVMNLEPGTKVASVAPVVGIEADEGVDGVDGLDGGALDGEALEDEDGLDVPAQVAADDGPVADDEP